MVNAGSFAIASTPPVMPMHMIAMVAGTLVCSLALLQQDGGSAGLCIMVVVGLAATVSGIAGFAFSAIAGGMLFHLCSDTVRVVQIMITCSIFNQAAMCLALRRSIRWCALPSYLAGGSVGVIVGVWLLLHMDRTTYTAGLGIFLLAFGSYMLCRRPIVLGQQHAAIDAGIALLSGICGGAAGFPSAFVAPWCGMKGWEKDQQRALVQPFILVLQVVALFAIGVATGPGRHAGIDSSILLFVPASLLGTSLGMALYHRLSNLQFARALSIALIVSGVAYTV